MNTSQRVSRGFHRLGLLLAAIPLLLGGLITVTSVDWRVAIPSSSPEWRKITYDDDDQNTVVYIEGFKSRIEVPNSALRPEKQRQTINNIAGQLWSKEFAEPLAKGIAITLALSLGVYGLFRALGWVIGGFTSS